MTDTVGIMPMVDVQIAWIMTVVLVEPVAMKLFGFLLLTKCFRCVFAFCIVCFYL